MHRIANIIVDHAKAVLVIVLALTLVSVAGVLLVQINYDQTKYLPEDSDTRIGLALMNQEFEETTPLTVMVSGVDDSSDGEIAADLEGISGVASVTYEDDSSSEDYGTYHQQDSAKYVLELTGGTYSGEADQALANVNDYCDALEQAGYETYVGGSIVDYKSMFSALPKVIAIALALLLVVLLIMCTSWVEPFLFLVNIAVAVVLNMGTNFIFGTVSQTTFSIGAVLQLVLSMDYSIMLMDRYRLLRPKSASAADAMKQALAGGFSSITASSFTTLAGMLCLLAMSFTIGADMGRVLAKGVFMSLITVFTVLPTMTVLLDAQLIKYKKKAPLFTGKALARFSYKLRPAVLCCFVVLVAVGFGVKNLAGVSFFTASYNPDQQVIDDTFGTSEQVVVLYDLDDEASVDAVMDEFAQNPGIESVSAYYNTLGTQLDAEELSDSLGMSLPLIKMAFYMHFVGEDTSPMTVAEFVSFVQSLSDDPDLGDMIPAGSLDQLEMLADLSDPEQIQSAMTPSQMAELLGVDEEQLSGLYLYYFLSHGGVDEGAMTVAEFVNFLSGQAQSDTAGLIDTQSAAQLQQLSAFTSASANNQQLTPAQLATRLGVDTSMMQQVFQYRYLTTANVESMVMTLPQALAALLAMADDPTYGSQFGAEDVANLTAMQALCSTAAAGQALGAEQLAGALGIDSALVGQLFSLYGMLHGCEAPTAMTLPDFIAFLCDEVSTNDMVLGMLDPTSAAMLSAAAGQLGTLRPLIDASAAGTQMTYGQVAGYLGMDASTMQMVYRVAALSQGASVGTMSVTECLTMLCDDSTLSSQMSASQLAQLKMIRSIVQSVNQGASLTSDQMAQLLGMDASQASQAYLYARYSAGDVANWTVSAYDLVSYAVTDIVGNSDSLLASNVSSQMLSGLQFMLQIMDSALEQVSYTPEELTALFTQAQDLQGLMGGSASGAGSASGTGDSADQSVDLTDQDVSLLYLLHDSQEGFDSSWTMSLYDFVVFAADELCASPLFEDQIDEASREDLQDARQLMDDGKDKLLGTEYGRAILTVGFDKESQDMHNLIGDLRESLDAAGVSYYLLGDAAMAYDMGLTFQDELNFISILTAAVIFLIVALTFKGVILPAILVLMIQTAFNLTMGICALQGLDTYYLAIMIVQAMLMGATIDYAILFSTNYRQSRKRTGIKQSLAVAYRSSLGTIMTSGTILIGVLLVVGNVITDQTTSEICLTIVKGALIAVLLVVFVLPGLLAMLDRFVAGKGVVDGKTELPEDELQEMMSGETACAAVKIATETAAE